MVEERLRQSQVLASLRSWPIAPLDREIDEALAKDEGSLLRRIDPSPALSLRTGKSGGLGQGLH